MNNKLVLVSGIAIFCITVVFASTNKINNIDTIQTSNGTKTTKNIGGTIISKWISANNNYTIYKPMIFFKLSNTNYRGEKISNYSFNTAPPNNANITWDDGLHFQIISGKSNAYTTIWYNMGDLFKHSRNLQISYDVIFKNNASWGGINIGNDIYIDVNPSRVGFRGPEVFTGGISKNELHHIDIYLNEVGKGLYKVQIYVDNKKMKEYVYSIPNIISYHYIGLRSNYYEGDVIFQNVNIISQDLSIISASSGETPLHEYTFNNGKEEFRYTYNGYYKPFGPNRGYWNVELIGCVGDYSLTPTTNGGKKCEMWCTIGSSKIGYCKIK